MLLGLYKGRKAERSERLYFSDLEMRFKHFYFFLSLHSRKHQECLIKLEGKSLDLSTDRFVNIIQNFAILVR